MNTALDFICFLVAVVLFVLAAIPVAVRQINLMAAGLFFFALPFLFAAWPGGVR